MLASKTPKYQSVASALRKGIMGGSFPVGQSLPPMKELAAQYGVSFVTAVRAVGILSDEGFISTTKKRNGSVVVRNRPIINGSTTIACLLRCMRARNDMDNFGQDIVDGLREEISRRGYRMIYHGLDEEDYERRMLELREGDICGVILDQKTPRPTVERLLRTGLPTVMFNRHLALPGLSTVTPDCEEAGRASADFLLDRGYERLGFYKMPIGEARWTAERAADHAMLVALRKGFLDRARERGLEGDRLVLIPEPADPATGRFPETFGLPRRRLADWRSLGVLCSSDYIAADLVAAVGSTDLELGRDVGVVGCFDLEVGQNAPRPPSTWAVDRAAVGAVAVRELLKRVETPEEPVASVRLAMRFVDRGTA